MKLLWVLLWAIALSFSHFVNGQVPEPDSIPKNNPSKQNAPVEVIRGKCITPTFFETKEFTEFLFAMMYGDVFYGSLLLLTGEKNSKSKNEVISGLHGARYLIFLMGFFAIYNGLIYNDVTSMSINGFNKQQWEDVTPVGYEHPVEHGKAPGVYVFGIDQFFTQPDQPYDPSSPVKDAVEETVGVSKEITAELMEALTSVTGKDKEDSVELLRWLFPYICPKWSIWFSRVGAQIKDNVHNIITNCKDVDKTDGLDVVGNMSGMLGIVMVFFFVGCNLCGITDISKKQEYTRWNTIIASETCRHIFTYLCLYYIALILVGIYGGYSIEVLLLKTETGLGMVIVLGIFGVFLWDVPQLVICWWLYQCHHTLSKHLQEMDVSGVNPSRQPYYDDVYRRSELYEMERPIEPQQQNIALSSTNH